MQTLRFADPITVNQYPLPIAGPADWQAEGEGFWRAAIALPALSAGDMIAPSLSVRSGGDYRFTFSLITTDKSYPLRTFPTRPDDGVHADPTDQVIRTAIDCYHLLAAPGDCRLEVRCHTAERPQR